MKFQTKAQINKNICIIGLTGGIGSGKSTVASRLRELGAYVIDADQIGRELMTEQGEAYNRVVEAFKKDDIFVNSEMKTIDRSKLRSLVFKDQKKRKLLEGILHPLIRKHAQLKIDQILTEQKSEKVQNPSSSIQSDKIIVFYEAALLIETNTLSDFDKVVVVVTSRENQVKWAAKRDHKEPFEIEAIINSQASDEARRKSGHILIENTGSKEDLIRNVDKLYKELAQN